MKNKLTTPISMTLLVVLFFALVLLNNQLFTSARVDLTESKVYSLSDGSKEILNTIDEPIHLYFFFSEKASEGITSLRNYANRVESLLQEYESAAEGKIRLHLVDPEPFSEAEDQADEFGLTAASIGPAGDAIYLGLAGRNALDDEKIIPFFDPQKEQFLEYEISKMVYQLTNSKPIKVGLITSLAITGGQNPMTGRFDPEWTFYTQLQQLNEVETLSSDVQLIPEDIDVLLLIHPKNLSDATLFAIDQFVLGEGKLIAFLDPHHESDPMSAMSGMASANPSDLGNLLSGWGIQFDSSSVLLDAAAGLDIRTQTGVAKHVGFVGLSKQQLDVEDVITSSLDTVNGASFGYFDLVTESALTMTPLIKSTEYAGQMNNMVYAMTRQPEQLLEQFNQELAGVVLAGRFTGAAKSAFDAVPDGLEASEHVKSTEQLNVLLFGDTDLLADRFWVSQANFFGQTIFTPFADNGAMLTNAVENLGGSNALISIRSRGTFARPFTRVEELTFLAEQKFREQEQLLQQQLDDTEQQLSELQGQQGEGGMLVLNQEQQEAVESFMEKKIEIRKALREVRHQLDKDIEQLGSQLKFINIAVMPLVLVFLLFFIARMLRMRSR